ncbi:MAG: nuclear transport factor 2 family protein [Acidobacteriaceae bacterium]
MNSDSDPRLLTDPALAKVLAQLIRREPIFHRPEFGTTRTDFENMTAKDYWEVGASGRRYSRNYVLDTLEQRFQQDQSGDVWEASDFCCRKLAQDVYLLTYTLLQRNERKTRRATIWQHTPEGWKIAYYQGTVVQDG